VLGVVQGITEFLPISSTGHLILVPALFGWQGGIVDQLSFDVALHLGTLVGLVWVFWHEWTRLARAGLSSLLRRSLTEPEARQFWLIVLATIPAGVAGLTLEGYVETTLRSPIVVGASMVLVGLLLALVDRSASQAREAGSLGAAGALTIGVAQALALVPGVSRSGSTIGAGLLLGLTRASAARFSFLLSAPIILAAVAKQGLEVAQHGLSGDEMAVFAVGISASALSGYLCIRLLLAYLRRRSLLPFIVYRIAVGMLVILLALAGRI
jgi:undecaprenyl-diphosphatase